MLALARARALALPIDTPRRQVLCLVALMILREALMSAIGPHFVDSTDGMWQFLSPADLNRPWTDLLNIHHQPPVWNTLLWLSHRMLGDSSLLMWTNKASTLITACCLTALLRPWCAPAWALGAAVVFLFLPETAAYEAWSYSSHFTMMLVTVNLLLFSRATLSEGAARLRMTLAWVLSMIVLGFDRQTYSVVLLGGLLLVFGTLTLRLKVRQLVVLSLLLAMPFAWWQTKNHQRFDSWSMSTWASRNLYRIATLRLSAETLRQTGCGGVSTIPPFSNAKAYADLPEVKAFIAARPQLVGHVPDAVEGMNSMAFAATAPSYLQAFSCVVRRVPSGYGQAVLQAWALYFTPSADYPFVKPMAKAWDTADRLIRRVIYLQPMDEVFGERSTLRRLLARSAVLLLVLAWFTTKGVRWMWQRESWQAGHRRALLLYGLSLVWLNAMSNFIDIGENMRFRYDVNALYLLGMAMFATEVWQKVASRWFSAPAGDVIPNVPGLAHITPEPSQPLAQPRALPRQASGSR